jgi:hypothetical protein
MNTLKKVLNLFTLRFLQLAIAIYLSTIVIYGLSVEDGITLPENITYLPIILNCILILLCALEFMHVKPFIRLAYLLFALIIGLSAMDKNMAYLNASIWLFAIITVVITLISLFLAHGQLKRVKERAEQNGGTTLPIFCYCKEDYVVAVITCTVAVILCLALIVIYNVFVADNWQWTLFFPIFCLLLVMFFIPFKFNHYRKCLNSMEQTCDYKGFLETCEKFKAGRLHPETLNNLNSLQVYYSLGCDINYADKLMENALPSSSKMIKPLCDIVAIYYNILKGEYVRAGELIYVARTKNPANKELEVANKMLVAFNSADVIPQIEAVFPVSTKKNYKNTFNAYILMIYYSRRGENEKAKYYANLVVAHADTIKEFAAQANKLLGE